MVLDNVLEIAVDESGPVFVSGSDAYEFLYGREEPDADADLGKLAGLSVEALKYAQELPIDDIGILSSRLYFYNRIPASPQWLKTLPTEQAVARLLRIDDEGANRHRLSRAWREASQTPSREGWRVWRRHTRSRERDKDSGALYKLYVSPAPTAIEEAFAETMEAVTLADGRCFKIGRDVYGLLRPDKLVAYFDTFCQLWSCAERLQNMLADCPAHGVPFTADFAGNALLSWGVDPSNHAHTLTWSPQQESWRLWVTNHLASALLSAMASHGSSVEPWKFALRRLAFDGVDTDTWIPDSAMWAGPSAAERVK
ncbi:hypothetical protein OG756_02135 [Streptomyces sp. NBC_01310]|uniref:hypothetical protein n=1 Tax=Streptomyces sp. NBC_01310 TaxID=2903820 RepID=UPI0035B5FB21|nr:hypothetical protein OG756_02135 [Streptomyces sp. NBC_01310]